jgi:endonuclease-3 related protein
MTSARIHRATRHPSVTSAALLMRYYDTLRAHYGDLHWWPGQTPLEILVGAVLTQNTAWVNVEKAIVNLKNAGLLPEAVAATPAATAAAQEAALRALHALRPRDLAPLIRPAGYFNLKAQRLWNLLDFLQARCGGRLEALAAIPTPELRTALLGVKGVGPETADAILLYALERPVFVIDAYTHRVWKRHGLAPATADYADLQTLAQTNLPPDRPLFNDYHAQLVIVGKDFCKPSPRCHGCPLEGLLPKGGPRL